jgi:U3 small nucleolar RNA-associated protein 22
MNLSQGMFIHPEEDYDFVVKLQPAVLPRYFQNITANSSISINKHASALPMDDEWPLRPGFDPAEAYLNDLTVRKQHLLARTRWFI